MPGLSILNVGAGDTTLSFDPKKPAEVERACKIVDDMIRRGFAILVQVGMRKGEPLYQRAKGFDPKTREYIIVGTPDELEEAKPATPEKVIKRKKPIARRLPAATTKAVAVARSAGG